MGGTAGQVGAREGSSEVQEAAPGARPAGQEAWLAAPQPQGGLRLLGSTGLAPAPPQTPSFMLRAAVGQGGQQPERTGLPSLLSPLLYPAPAAGGAHSGFSSLGWPPPPGLDPGTGASPSHSEPSSALASWGAVGTCGRFLVAISW